MVKQHSRDVKQFYWRENSVPFAELRATYDSQLSYKKHSHQQLSLGLIVAGATQTTYLNKLHQVNKGQLILIEPNKVHSCNPLPQQSRSYFMLYFNNDWCLQRLSELYQQAVNNFSCTEIVFEDDYLIVEYQKLLLHIKKKRSVRVIIERIALHIFSHYCQINSMPKQEIKLLSQVKFFLLENIQQVDDLPIIAKKVGFSQEMIIRSFKKQLGITPKAYLNNIRIEQAKLLLQTGQKIVDVALQLGFNDQSHFHRTFVNYCAITPKQYQQVNFVQ